MSRPDRKLACDRCDTVVVANKVGEKRAFAGNGKLLAIKCNNVWVCAMCKSAHMKPERLPDPAESTYRFEGTTK